MKVTQPTQVRCAIYTRKSSDDGLELAFNSLDAQYARCADLIRAHADEGWVLLEERYDDGGYSGGNTERPALRRLLADIEAGTIDVVILYRLDRLSRNARDFYRILDLFDKHGVSFACVTEQHNTTTPMGRMGLHIAMGFNQYEREVAAERTRHKIESTRKKGLWTGGTPLLGYDILRTPSGSRLVLNPEEADQVRRIYALYLEKGSLIPTVQALAAEGIVTKRWTTSAGKERGGVAIDKTRLHQLLTNVLYLGKIKHHDQVYEGQHDRIIDDRTWKRVQMQLQENAVTGGAKCRNRYGATLRGLLHCGTCGAKMTHQYSQKRNVRYRYYVCAKAQKHGWSTCRTKSIPAREIEQFVLDEIRAIGTNREVLDATIEQVRSGAETSITELRAERGRLQQRSRRDNAALSGNTSPEHLAELSERIPADQARLVEIEEEIMRLERALPTSDQIAAALADLDLIWKALSPREQSDLIALLIQRVEYEGPAGTISITYHPSALVLLKDEVGKRRASEAAA